MMAATKTLSRPVPRPIEVPYAGPWPTRPLTMQEQLERIEAMGQRIGRYVQFMCQIGSLGGSSAEAKEKAVTMFYERMVAVEEQLGRIQENVQLE